jgi:Kef-type K+ transport system membrane component KefB
MGITAFPVLARILADRKLMHTRVGMYAISCAVFDDITAWCLLAVVTVIARPDRPQNALFWRFAGLIGYALAMVFLIRPALRRLSAPSEASSLGRSAAAMILLLLSVWTTETLGVHALFGAFMAGIVMPKGSKLEEELRGRLETATQVLLLPLFFAYTGLRTNFDLLYSIELWGLGGLIVMVALGSKLLVSARFVRASGMSWRESLAVGVLVNSKGLVELVILNVGRDLHILSPTLFSMMVIMGPGHHGNDSTTARLGPTAAPRICAAPGICGERSATVPRSMSTRPLRCSAALAVSLHSREVLD